MVSEGQKYTPKVFSALRDRLPQQAQKEVWCIPNRLFPRETKEKSCKTPKSEPIFGKGMRRSIFQWKKGFFSEKGGGNSVNEGFGKDFYSKGNSVKSFGPFTEPPDSENWKVAVLIPFPKISSYKDLSRCSLKTLTSLNKEVRVTVRPFLLSDSRIWSLPSVSSLSDYSIWRSWRLLNALRS